MNPWRSDLRRSTPTTPAMSQPGGSGCYEPAHFGSSTAPCEPSIWRAICRVASAEIADPKAVKLAAAIASAKTVAAVASLTRADRRHAATVEQ
jgi:hypothetical protein